MCPKESMSTKPMVRMSALFAITDTFLRCVVDLIQKYVMIVII